MSNIQKIYEFTKYVRRFKEVERFSALVGVYPWINRFESDADHTWRMAMLLVLIEKKLSKPIDFKKAMKMTLIHDIPEIIAGDAQPLGAKLDGKNTHAYNEDIAEAKQERERKAAKEIFGKLDAEDTEELMDIWEEFEALETYEAKVVKALDRWEGKLQSFEYTGGKMYKKHFDFLVKFGKDNFKADPVTEELGEILIKELTDSFQEYKEE